MTTPAMPVTVTIEKLSEPWKKSRPWRVAMFDAKAKVPGRPVLEWHKKTKKDAEAKVEEVKASAYYRQENGLA